MKMLIVTKRADDFHVHLAGDMERWGWGPTVDAAIGDFVRHNAELVDLHVFYGSHFDQRSWKAEDSGLRFR